MNASEDPYRPPSTEVDGNYSVITHELIKRLISGEDIETLVIPKRSNMEIYGNKHRRILTGDVALSAEASGCIPEVYQAIYWVCFASIPIWPVGTFAIMPCKTDGMLESGSSVYRAIRLRTDIFQLILHLTFVILMLIAFFGWVLTILFDENGLFLKRLR